jgi:rubrerythrin
MFFIDNPHCASGIYNLSGGILGWNHITVPDLPKFMFFDAGREDASLADLLLAGMNLERGASNFYMSVLEKHPEAAFARPVELLARAEEGHARLLYSFLAKEQTGSPAFEEIYDSLSGDIVEGGQRVDELVARLGEFSGDACLDIVEMALSVEFAAYDLYRAMAHRYCNTPMEEPFLAIAQAEKEHMRIASEALRFCE